MTSKPSEPSEPLLLGVVNQKGGVGKTTISVNIAGGLASRGHDVLLGDMDPQGHLTNAIGLFEPHYLADPPHLYSALMDPSDHSVEDLVVPHTEFDVIPSNIEMFELARDLIASGRQPSIRLQRLLDDVRGYDFVVIDAPPRMDILTDNVLLGTRNLIVPAKADDFAKHGLDLLFNQIDLLEEDYGTPVKERMIIASDVEYPLDNEQKRMLEWFNTQFGDLLPVFEIRDRAVIRRALRESNGSIFAHDEECDMESVFLEIASELERIRDEVVGMEQPGEVQHG